MTGTTSAVEAWSTRSTPTRVIDVLAIGIAVGTLTGLLHALVLGVTWFVFGRMVWFSREFVWMAPLAYTLVLAPGVLPLAAVAFRVRSQRLFVFAAWAASTAGLFGLLLPFSAISRASELILSMGFAVQVARLVNAAPHVWASRFRRVAGVNLGVVAAFALLLSLSRRAAERRAALALPPTAADAPNVLLIILDTVRAASLSLYGAPEETTPHLARWAREGVAFDWAFSVAPWTLPSHASMFTGRYAGELRTDWKVPLDRTDSTLAEVFASRGYATGGFVGNLNYTAWDSGLNRGFAHYEDHAVSWGQLWRSTSYTQTAAFDTLIDSPSLATAVRMLLHPDLSIDPQHRFERRTATQVAGGFMAWQHAAAQRHRPFFGFLNLFDAHKPYHAPAAFRQFHSGSPPIDAYRSAILYLDATIDSVLTALRERGILENTIVVVTSDHGELFDEHGLNGHAHNLYRNVLHVPFIIRFPKRVPGERRVSQVVSLRDLPATILDLAGLLPAVLPGRSLASTWALTTPGALAPVSAAFAEANKAPNVDPAIPTGRGPLSAAVGEAQFYIHGPLREEALFNYRTDPRDSINLALTKDSVSLLAPWRARMDSVLQSRRRLRAPPSAR